MDPGSLEPFDFLICSSERFWVDIQPFLLGRGFQLRQRYDPDWKPSWLQVENIETQTGKKQPSPILFEDALGSTGDMLDAIRIEDVRRVVFKKVKTSTNEIPIALLFSSEANRKDTRNYCVPILDVVMVPGTDDEALLVMPHLLNFDLLPYRFLGEFYEFALQMLEGLEFMHEHNVAHRDACWFNIMMDTTKVIPKGHHFCRWYTHDGLPYSKLDWNIRWSVRPVKYYLIDFGLSSLCTSKESLVLGTFGQDKTVPELSREVPYNPFMVDIYHIGNVFKQCIQDYKGLGVFTELAALMTSPDPMDRPTASNCVEMCKAIIDTMTRSRRPTTRIWRRTSDLYTSLSPIEKLAVICGRKSKR